MNRVLFGVMCVGLSISACGDESATRTMPAESVGASTQSLVADFVDAKGHHWRAKPTTNIAPDSAKMPTTASLGKFSDAAINAWSDAQWKEALRPIAFYDGKEYEQLDSDPDLIKKLRAAQAAQAAASARSPEAPPTARSSAGSGALVGSPAIPTPNGTTADGDDRVPFTTTQVAQFPQRAVGVLNGNGLSTHSNTCTMTLIGASTAISAAHCFYDVSTHAWRSTRSWAFGVATHVTGGTTVQQRTYPLYTGCYWVTIPSAFNAELGDIFYDYAVIEFSNSQAPTCNLFPGNVVGSYGNWTATDQQINTSTMFLNGYPSEDLPTDYATQYPWPSEYWHPAGVSVNTAESYVLNLNTAYQSGGDSGAAVAQTIFGGTTRYVTGIFKGSATLNPTIGYARRLDSTVSTFIIANSAL